MEHFDVKEFADRGSEERKERADTSFVTIVFVSSFVSIIGFCLTIIFVMVLLTKRVHKSPSNLLSPTVTECKELSMSSNSYTDQPRRLEEGKEPGWSLQT